MKLLPIPLSPLNPPAPLGIWGSDLLWRYPPAPPSPLADLKTQLPPQLNTDPRIWGRDEVAVFLRFCEREFDLPKFDLDLFQMNGKALCVLTKNDLAERSPGAGDVLHNVLQMLVRDAQTLHRHLPSSPVTPTSRYPLSPHSHPPTPNWSALAPPDSPFFHNSHLQQFMAASNSVTLSPAPSIDSQAGSPPQSHQEQLQNVFQKSSSSSSSHTQNSTSGGSSNQSDSDEDNSTAGYHPLPLSHPDSKLPLLNPSNQSPPLTPISKETQHLGQLQLLDTKTLQYPVSALLNNSSNANAISSSPSAAERSSNGNSSNGNGSSSASNGHSLNLKSPTLSPPSSASPNGSSSAPTTPGAFLPVKREFFPDGPEPNTNGRLLWDFLQQLLNDPAQRYSSYIAWKCRDTGVFKIVDPAGLAKLWGKQKNHLSMNYDKMSRALRYYYRVNILRKVQGERHCYQFLRNPTELKSIKNISLLRQTMANQNANGQSVAAAAAANAASQHSLMSLLPNGANIHHLAAAAVAAAASHQQQQQANGPLSPSALHHPHATSAASAPSSNGQSANGASHHPTIKMETDMDELKPTDLSTGSDRKYYGTGSNGVDCYPLIRNANGLTTIQLLRQQQQQQQSQQGHDSGSPPTSPSPLSLNSQSLHTISNNLHHLHQQQMQAQAAAAAAAVAAAEARHREEQEEQRRHEQQLAAEHHDRDHERNDRSPSPANDHHHQQQQHQPQQQQHRGSDDESMMPTDLSKSDSMYYK